MRRGAPDPTPRRPLRRPEGDRRRRSVVHGAATLGGDRSDARGPKPSSATREPALADPSPSAKAGPNRRRSPLGFRGNGALRARHRNSTINMLNRGVGTCSGAQTLGARVRDGSFSVRRGQSQRLSPLDFAAPDRALWLDRRHSPTACRGCLLPASSIFVPPDRRRNCSSPQAAAGPPCSQSLWTRPSLPRPNKARPPSCWHGVRNPAQSHLPSGRELR